MFGNPETTPGGRALKFYASVRVEVRKGDTIKDKDNEVIGHIIKAKVVKNKVAPPYKEAQFELIYGKGVNRLGEILDLGIKFGIIGKSGSWFSYNDIQLGQGRDRALEFLKENPKIYPKLSKKLWRRLKRG